MDRNSRALTCDDIDGEERPAEDTKLKTIRSLLLTVETNDTLHIILFRKLSPTLKSLLGAENIIGDSVRTVGPNVHSLLLGVSPMPTIAPRARQVPTAPLTYLNALTGKVGRNRNGARTWW